MPEALAFERLHKIPREQVIGLDLVGNPAPAKRRRVLQILKTQKEIDVLAIFCHGWRGGIQLGFLTGQGALIDALAQCLSREAKIVLYACWAAENETIDTGIDNVGIGTDGGFADWLRDELRLRGFTGWVDAHKTKGHVVYNPYVVRFSCASDEPGGQWIVAPSSADWARWRALLCDPKSTLRYRFPLREIDEVRREVRA